MAKFIIINGKNAKIVNCKSLKIAYHSAINISDHSKEIIVRELDELTDHTKMIESKLSAYSFLFDSVTKISDESPENEKICTKFLELLKYFDLNN